MGLGFSKWGSTLVSELLILSFDWAAEKFQEVPPLPDHDVRTHPIGDIGVEDASLYVTAMGLQESTFRMGPLVESRISFIRPPLGIR
ncbi:hypothetical protein L1049_017751 [Liquidambar formosana]|uniref:Uncharacterized protein n=1 Tax=Liquidambar formosana TaxID=63359 RepID=A0AAP0S1R2_LIQFO